MFFLFTEFNEKCRFSRKKEKNLFLNEGFYQVLWKYSIMELNIFNVFFGKFGNYKICQEVLRLHIAEKSLRCLREHKKRDGFLQ